MARSRRYQGHDVAEYIEPQKKKKKRKKKKGWFWKIFFLSLLITFLILFGVCAYLLYVSKEQTDYLSKINESNTLEALMKDQNNIQIVTTYSHTRSGESYKATRLLRQGNNGLVSYYKVEGSDADYKEMIADGELWRNDEKVTYYYGLIGDEYNQNIDLARSELFTTYDKERIDNQTEKGDKISIKTTYEVQPDDKYTKLFSFNAGDVITRNITIDRATNQVVLENESYNDEEFYTYSVEFDVQNKTPSFYRKAKKQDSNRKCVVYYDYQGENEKIYSYDVPTGAYFTTFPQEGFTAYLDPECTKEFNEFEMQIQNPESLLTIYMKKEAATE